MAHRPRADTRWKPRVSSTLSGIGLSAAGLHSRCAGMEVLTTIVAGGHTIEFGVATTKAEREAARAQRFRVYQRQGYYREGVTEDQDEYDREAIYFLGRLRGAGPGRGVLVSSTRLIEGREDPGFEFPALKAFRFEMPAALQEVPVRRRAEVARLVSEQLPAVTIGRLTTVLGLILAIAEYAERTTLRCGLARRRLLRALEASGLRFHEIDCERVVYPREGPVAGYFFAHPDPVALIYWFADEGAPAVQRVLELRRPGLMVEPQLLLHPKNLTARVNNSSMRPGRHER